MVNQEVKSLVMEMKNIKQRHLDAEEELQLAYNRIKLLEDENIDIKADLEDALHNHKKVQEENSALGARSVPLHEHAPAPIAAPIPVNSVPNGLHNLNNQQQQSVSGHHHEQHSDHEQDHDHHTTKVDDDWNHGRQQARDSTLVNPTSVIHQESLTSFRNAVDDLLSAGR